MIERIHSKVIVCFLAIGALSALAAWSQTESTSVKPKMDRTPVFEVVSVHENTSHDGSMSWNSTPGGIIMKNMQLDLLLRSAYGLLYSNENQVIGLPPWAKSEHFDLEAKVSDEDAPLLKDLTDVQRDEMLMAILVDRFQLKAHIETKDGPIFALVIAKGGPKLAVAHPSTGVGDALDPVKKDATGEGGYMSSDREVDANAIPVESIVSILTSLAHREVVDKTGLKGKYSFNLKFTPDQEADAATVKSGDGLAPPLFTAIQEQLGLRLDPTRGPVRGVVVDHIEKPSAN